MVKQKSGLHKQVEAIFDGIPNPNDTNSGEVAQKAPVQPISSYFKSDGLGNQTVNALNNPKPSLKQPQVVQQPIITQATFRPQEKTPARGVMLPASLTSKPSAMKFVDKIKLKLAEIEQKGGRRQVIATVLIPILAIGLIIALWKNLAPASQSAVGEAKEASLENGAMSAANKAINWPAVKPFPQTLRDPMKAYVGAIGQGQMSANLANITVNGILYDRANPELSKAIINGQHTAIGETVLGMKVIDISENSVILDVNGKPETISIGCLK